MTLLIAFAVTGSRAWNTPSDCCHHTHSNNRDLSIHSITFSA